MKYTLTLLTLLGLLFHSSCVFADIEPAFIEPIPAKATTLTGMLQSYKNLAARKYTLGPNDVINISVLGFPELSHEKLKIQPDGKVILAMIGPIAVEGLTLEELYNTLTQKYSTYFRDPKLSVELVEAKPFIIYITGAVLNPGSYEVMTNPANRPFSQNGGHPDITVNRTTPLLSNMMVAAGGLSFDADLENIRIENKVTGETIPVNLLKLLTDNDTNQDIYLSPGDTVVVPRLSTPLALDEKKYKLYASSSLSPRTVPVKVYGYVNTPGLVNLNTSQSLNLLSAITAAGGYLKDSAYAPSKVILYRAVDAEGTLASRVINPLDKDVQLMPNDIVYVPQKPVPRTGLLFDYLTRVITPFTSSSYIYRNLVRDPLFR